MENRQYRVRLYLTVDDLMFDRDVVFQACIEAVVPDQAAALAHERYVLEEQRNIDNNPLYSKVTPADLDRGPSCYHEVRVRRTVNGSRIRLYYSAVDLSDERLGRIHDRELARNSAVAAVQPKLVPRATVELFDCIDDVVRGVNQFADRICLMADSMAETVEEVVANHILRDGLGRRSRRLYARARQQGDLHFSYYAVDVILFGAHDGQVMRVRSQGVSLETLKAENSR